MYQLNPFLREFWATPDRHKVLFGGRASSKSHDAAGMAVYLAANYTLKFLCARQFQNKISDSVYTLIKDKIENSEFASEFVFTKTSIIHKITGSSFLFYGIARNLNEIKSTEGVDVLWLEEANYLTQAQWDVIHPTIRKQGSQVWIIFNPGEFLDFAYQHFVVEPPERTTKLQINWDNNPYLTDTMVEVIKDEYKRDPENAAHVYGGLPRMGQDKAVITLTYILAAIDAHKRIALLDADKPEAERRVWEATGKKTIGFDIADDGDDLCATIEAQGNIVTGASEWKGLEDELLKSSTLVFNRAIETGSSITFDSIGVGANAGPKFKELNESREARVQYEAFNAGGAVDNPDGIYMKLPHINIKNKDHFSNIKAQKWSDVADRFRKTYEVMEKGATHPIDQLVSIDSSTISPKMLDKIKKELCTPRKDVDGNGRFKVEGKKDLARRGVKSPNLADAFIMALIKAKRRPGGFFG